MIIENIYIESFGSLSDRSIDFGDRMNIIRGNNESGKSTVFAFIKFMFYGLSRGGAERARYMNWNSSFMGGTLTFGCEEGHFRIERKVTVSGGEREVQRESLKVIDLDSSEQCFKGEGVGEHFFGVPENVFLQTAQLSQLSDGNVDGKSLSEAIENILFSGDESVNTKKALDKLDKIRKVFVHKKGDGGRVFELRAKADELRTRLDSAKKANSEIIELEGAIRADKETLSQLATKLSELSAQNDCHESMMVLKRFKTLRMHELKISELELELDELKANRGSDGRLPEQSELAEMKLLRRDILEGEQEAKILSSTVEAMDSESGEISSILEKSRILDENGGSRAVLARALELSSTAKKTLGMGIASVALGIAAVVIAVLFSYALYGSVALGALALLGGILFAVSASKKKALRGLCMKFGIDGKLKSPELLSALQKTVTDTENGKAEAESKQSELIRLKGQLENKYAVLEARRSQLSLKLSGWVLISHAHDEDGVIAYCEELLNRAYELSRERQSLEIARRNLKSELSGQNESELAAQFKDIDIEELEKLNIVSLRRERDFTADKITSLETRVSEKTAQLAALRARAEDPALIYAELEKISQELESAEERCDAYLLAHDAIERATQSLRSGIAPHLSSVTASITDKLTSGRYSNVGVDPSFGLSYESLSSTHSIDYMSIGTKTSVYIALRVALIRMLYTKTLPPMAFDESFAHLDDVRASNLLGLLSELADEGMQTLIFTCHDREAELALPLGDNKIISLD